MAESMGPPVARPRARGGRYSSLPLLGQNTLSTDTAPDQLHDPTFNDPVSSPPGQTWASYEEPTFHLPDADAYAHGYDAFMTDEVEYDSGFDAAAFDMPGDDWDELYFNSLLDEFDEFLSQQNMGILPFAGSWGAHDELDFAGYQETTTDDYSDDDYSDDDSLGGEWAFQVDAYTSTEEYGLTYTDLSTIPTWSDAPENMLSGDAHRDFIRLPHSQLLRLAQFYPPIYEFSGLDVAESVYDEDLYEGIAQLLNADGLPEIL
ncbi:hypothetical protein F5X96DRAFT_395518 [Biscogniauxia mediterranea]|nr:hypothetical protein F5X96DRAFT_395518 [Biscogniauxia mediterranea]